MSEVASNDGVAPGDPVLIPYLGEADETRAEELLNEILEKQVRPPVLRVVAFRLSWAHASSRGIAPQFEVEDVGSEALATLSRRLRSLRVQTERAPILSLRAYAVGVAHHGCDSYLRRRNPYRFALRLRIRSAIESGSNVRLTKLPDGALVCELLDAAVPDASERDSIAGRHLLPAIRQLLAENAGRMPLDELTTSLQRRYDAATLGLQESIDDHDVEDEQLLVEDRLVQKEHLEALWREILALPTNQRRALLLNLRGPQGEDVLPLLPFAGVATIRQIAAAVEIDVHEFAEIWKHLPWDDLTIAARLQLTRQQVINLRKSARDRLGRRLRR